MIKWISDMNSLSLSQFYEASQPDFLKSQLILTKFILKLPDCVGMCQYFVNEANCLPWNHVFPGLGASSMQAAGSAFKQSDPQNKYGTQFKSRI